MSTLTTPATRSTETGLTAAQNAAVVCDLAPLGIISISGTDAGVFLQGQLSADVIGLPPGECRYGSFNSPKGRMLANFVLWRHQAAEDDFCLLLPMELVAPIAKRLAMYRLRAKASIADVSSHTLRLGIGGPEGHRALNAAFGVAPAPFESTTVGDATLLGLPGPRFIVLVPQASADATREKISAHAASGEFDVWQWLTIRAGVPVITAVTQDSLVAQTANWDVLGGIDFKKGCYTGQEIIARMQYLGRLKERTFLFHADVTLVTSGERIFSAAFAEQPCGTVINSASAPGGGCDLLAVLQISAAELGDARLGSPNGPPLMALPLPYAIPAGVAPRGRSA